MKKPHSAGKMVGSFINPFVSNKDYDSLQQSQRDRERNVARARKNKKKPK